jgi:hypothetical protein
MAEGLRPAYRWLALVQGTYYALSGAWPLVSIWTFQRATGPKTDLWLVQTVGMLVFVIGAALLMAARSDGWARPARWLGSASAAGFVMIDVTYVLNGTLRPVYLADALIECLALAGWLWTGLRPKRMSAQP